jgi:radical SAM superfamily enzyme YgiQ (UPF0313 family)
MNAALSSLVLLVGPEVEENLGIRSIAASLELAGVRTEIAAYDFSDALADVRDLALALNPSVIAISLAFQWRAEDAFALAMALRESGYRGHITAGGHFATFCWQEVLTNFPEFDSLCLGEAEETVVELVEAIAHRRPLERVHGLALVTSAGQPVTTPPRPQPDIDSLPDVDRRGEAAVCLGHPIATLVASRGCYGNCTFCCIAAWHKRMNVGQRWRLRSADAVAGEMARLHREQGAEIFVFHDDNFLPPGHDAALERIHALADALESHGVRRIGTVVKARPNDVTPEIFAALRDRLGLTRVFIGIENDSPQGLKTLRRGVRRDQNHRAMEVLAELGIYACFNLLIWDPDTDLDAFETNLEFMEEFADSPFNFGRVELYAGTPLLARMQREGRCEGDWMGWNYQLAGREIQRVFDLAMLCFEERNFSAHALANRLMGTRFDVEIARRFHPVNFDTEWLAEAKRLSHTLATDSAAGLRRIVAFVKEGGRDEGKLVEDLSFQLRSTEYEILKAAARLEEEVQKTLGATCRHYRIGAPIGVAKMDESIAR